jgi:hypothetical protein
MPERRAISSKGAAPAAAVECLLQRGERPTDFCPRQHSTQPCPPAGFTRFYIADIWLAHLDPHDVPAFTALDEAADVAVTIVLEDLAYARIALDEEYVARLRVPFRGCLSDAFANEFAVGHRQRVGRLGILQPVAPREL